jgi:hypothetical protein
MKNLYAFLFFLPLFCLSCDPDPSEVPVSPPTEDLSERGECAEYDCVSMTFRSYETEDILETKESIGGTFYVFEDRLIYAVEATRYEAYKAGKNVYVGLDRKENPIKYTVKRDAILIYGGGKVETVVRTKRISKI